jgi:hypothetical protein
MTIFDVAILVICTFVGIVLWRIFGDPHDDTGMVVGMLVGFLLMFTPYPTRAIDWLFERKKRRRTRKDDAGDTNNDHKPSA